MLHPRGQGDHRQVVGVGDAVDVAGETEGKGGQGNALGKTAARGASLDVEGRTARWLADSAGHLLPPLGQSLDQAHGGRGLALAEGGRGDRRHVDVFAVRLPFQAIEDLQEVHLADMVTHGDQFIPLDSRLFRQPDDGLHVLLGFFSDLPVLQLPWIQIRNLEHSLSLLFFMDCFSLLLSPL